MYTIKEVSKNLDMTEHSIRYYSDKGLIPNLQRDKHNNRVFDEKSLDWLNGVKCLRNCGMSIQAIKEYIELCLVGDHTAKDRYKIILEQKAIMDEKLKEIAEASKYINEKAEYYDKIVNHQIIDESNPDKW